MTTRITSVHASSVIAKLRIVELSFGRFRSGVSALNNPDLMYIVEIEKRLHQLSWILRETHDREMLVLAITEEMGVALDEQRNDEQLYRKFGEAAVPLEVLTEAFYQTAARIHDIADKKLQYLKFKADGVIKVRNLLIVHAEKDNGVQPPSFGVGGDAGPILKSARHEADIGKFHDAGLWANALAFLDSLNGSLGRSP